MNTKFKDSFNKTQEVTLEKFKQIWALGGWDSGTQQFSNTESWDKILLTAGDTVFNISNTSMSVEPFTNFTKRKSVNNRLNTSDPQYGLCLKTYNSDLYQNWINTEWIESANGINEASAVDVSDGTLSMDALNLSQKVYNFLNRIAVSGGTYRDWLETVYTGGNYMERCETPTFEGGVSQEIVFQEVIATAHPETNH